MNLQKNTFSPKYLYHYTTYERAQQILKEKTVRCYQDDFTFFTASHEDAVKVCYHVMKEGALYMDHSLSIRHRSGTDFRNYVILKIQCPAHTTFYHLSLEHPQDTFCSYDYSLMHKGDLHFQKAKILPLNTTASSCRKAVSKAAILGGTCILLGAMWTSSVYAGRPGWLDSSSSYDISWWNPAGTAFELDTAEKLAGLSFLVNDGNDMSGKVFNIPNDINLRSKKWTTIPDSFQGKIAGIDGIHKIFLAYGDIFLTDMSHLENLLLEYPKEGQECQHTTEQVVITEATPQTDALGAEECTQCGKVFKYYDIPGTACASFMQNTADAIRKATTNEVLVDTRLWTCLDKRVTDALLERKDVSLTINYSYQGTRYTVTIPAGTNAAELLDENGYCGFRYLDLLYHGTTLNE